MNARRLPPYAKRLREAQGRGEPVNVFIYAGARAHELARLKAYALAVPTDCDWRELDWSLLGGLGVTLVARAWTIEATADLARHLVLEGADLVVALTVGRDGPWPAVHCKHFVPDRARAAA